MYDSKETINDIRMYEEILGHDGKYKYHFNRYKDIFSDEITDSMKVEKFCYIYYNPWDTSYFGYLVYTCDDESYRKEYERLKNIKSSDNYLIYGAKEFPYELYAVYADPYYGYIYAMTNPERNQFIYVELQFYNYFSEIDNEKFIDKEHLPLGFDAKWHNKIQKEFLEGSW